MTDHTPLDTTRPGSRTTVALAALAAIEAEIRAAHAQPEAVKATWEPFWASRHAIHFHKAQQEVLDAITAELPALLAMVDAAYAATQYFQMRGRTDEQDHARIALDSALRALGIDPDAHSPDHERIDRALERGRKALEEGS